MQDAGNLIDVFIVDGDSGVTALRDQLDGVTKGCVDRGGGDFRPRYHDGMGFGLLQVEDTVDHIRFLIGYEAFGLTLIHEVMDLFGEVGPLFKMGFFPQQRFKQAQQTMI